MKTSVSCKTGVAKLSYLSQSRLIHTIAVCATLVSGMSGVAIAQSDADGAAVVTVVPVATQEFVARTWMSGSIVPVNSVSVVPLVSGYPVTSVMVDIGDVVSEGDVLATFDTADLEAELAQVDAQIESARAAINQARSETTSSQALVDQAASALERSQTLRDRGDVAQSTLDDAIAADRTARATLASAQEGVLSAQAALRQVQAARDAAQLSLDHTNLTAPVSGIIATRDLSQGDLPSSLSTAAFVIYEDGALEVAADVVETSLGALTIGDEAQLSIAGLPEQPGTLRLIAPTVDQTTRLGSVRITVPDADGIRAGLFTSGWIITDTRDSLSVPVTAVQTDADGTFVLVVEEGVLARTPVEAGLTLDGQREILSGLTEGQSVVARAAGFFADGDLVSPMDQEPSQ